MSPGDSVQYQRRWFVLVSIKNGWAVVRDDEGETMRVRASSLR